MGAVDVVQRDKETEWEKSIESNWYPTDVVNGKREKGPASESGSGQCDGRRE